MEARERYRTLHVRMRRTQVPSVALRVMQRWAATRPKGSVMIATSQGARGTSTETDDLSVQESRLWLDVPARWRYETDTHGYGTAVYVVDPPLWWSFAPSVHAITNEADPAGQPAATEHPEWLFFHARELMRRFEVTSSRVEDRDGREVEVADAVATDEPTGGMTPGADGYRFVVDRERDIALRVAASAEGIEFSVFEIVELAFDVPLGEELFRVSLPPGVAFGPPPTLGPKSGLGRLRERFPLRWRGW